VEEEEEEEEEERELADAILKSVTK